jgi:lipopolysaccharide transport system ATP-binding protein
MTDLRFDSVSKRYRIRSEADTPAKRFGSGLFRSRLQKRDFWAIRNVSFEVERGESVGIIGHNGAGKSTILKLLSNITTPTTGEIAINGKLSGLLEVGSGFHPELTGRENIFLSGAILGMRRSEIRRNLESIIDFADMRTLIDSPAKKYSSGMYVRLGFSIASHLNPDILLLDEVLAVGDFTFQDKCKQRIHELHRQGTTLVFISHDLIAVREICPRVILLDHGQIVADGAADATIRRYTETASFSRKAVSNGAAPAVQMTDVGFFDTAGQRRVGFRTGDSVHVRVEYNVNRPLPHGDVSLFFFTSDGTLAAQWTTAFNGPEIHMLDGAGCIEFSCRELGLQAGVYRIDAQIENGETREPIDLQEGCVNIHVECPRELKGSFYMPHTWRQTAAADSCATRPLSLSH